MITKRLGLVVVLLVVGLATVFLVPVSTRLQPAGVVLALPERIGDEWRGQDMLVSERERAILAADTGFARKVYTNRTGDQIYVSIVLSGEDMMNSIHRPERCLAAQGWNLLAPERAHVPLANGGKLKATRLFQSQPWPPTQPRFIRHDITYYWFIGSRDHTASHWTRTFYDIRDRLLHGENQRWAYVTVGALVTKGLAGVPQHDEADTIKLMENFIPQVVPTFERRAGSDPVAGL